MHEALSRWTAADPRPLVLLIDEIDALVGDSLLSVLRQLRAGYVRRPAGFPQSVVLCGVRDVRDYRIHSGSANAIVTGGSAFNVKAESLRLGDFSRDEVFGAGVLYRHPASGPPRRRDDQPAGGSRLRSRRSASINAAARYTICALGSMSSRA